jgi:hypothetical protein
MSSLSFLSLAPPSPPRSHQQASLAPQPADDRPSARGNKRQKRAAVPGRAHHDHRRHASLFLTHARPGPGESSRSPPRRPRPSASFVLGLARCCPSRAAPSLPSPGEPISSSPPIPPLPSHPRPPSVRPWTSICSALVVPSMDAVSPRSGLRCWCVFSQSSCALQILRLAGFCLVGWGRAVRAGRVDQSVAPACRCFAPLRRPRDLGMFYSLDFTMALVIFAKSIESSSSAPVLRFRMASIVLDWSYSYCLRLDEIAGSRFTSNGKSYYWFKLNWI